MAGPGVQMGPNAVSDPAALLSALKSQAPPPNPATSAERVNPDQQVLEHVKAAQVSLDRARAFTNDQQIQMAMDIMSGVLTKMLLKFDGMAVMQSLHDAVGSLPPPAVPAAGGAPMGQPGPGGPPMGGPPPGPPGAPGSPPMGGAPGPV